MFNTEVVVTGTWIKGKIHNKHEEKYTLEIDEITDLRFLDAQDLRVFTNELINIANKLDVLNGKNTLAR